MPDGGDGGRGWLWSCRCILRYSAHSRTCDREQPPPSPQPNPPLPTNWRRHEPSCRIHRQTPHINSIPGGWRGAKFIHTNRDWLLLAWNLLEHWSLTVATSIMHGALLNPMAPAGVSSACVRVSCASSFSFFPFSKHFTVTLV